MVHKLWAQADYCRFEEMSGGEVSAVLELAGGTAARLGLDETAKITWKDGKANSARPRGLRACELRCLACKRHAMSILGKIFTWWDGATVGTLLNSWSTGEKVGEDDLGNRYFRAKRAAAAGFSTMVRTTRAARRPNGTAGCTARSTNCRPICRARAARVGEGSNPEPDRQHGCLSPCRRARTRRPACGGDRRL